MLQIINGGIYKVVYNGIYGAEFIGEHPSLIIRTLKENEIYIVVPLTTYTKEKWEKIKRNGFGTRILSTNSIARIDKFQVIHRRDIKNRWIEGRTYLKVSPEELENVNNKLQEYVLLSSNKANREYSKYFEQYQVFSQDFTKIVSDNNNTDTIFNLNEKDKQKIFSCKKINVNSLTKLDIIEIVKQHYDIRDFTVSLENDDLKIIIKIDK